MKKADPFLVLFILSLLALFSAFLIPWPLPAILLSSACVAAAVLLLYRRTLRPAGRPPEARHAAHRHRF